MTLREQLGKPVLFHVVLWHGKDGPSLTGYDSRDPSVIGDQLSVMEELGGEGFGVVALTFGPTVSTFIHAASMEMCRQCSDRRVPFALMYDPWTVKTAADKNLAMIAALKHPDTQTILNSRSYLPGRPILDFATGASAVAVMQAVPGIEYWQVGIDYSWPKTSDTVNALKRDNALATMRLPAICLQFNDGTGADRNKSVWDQSKPARIVPARAGGLFWDTVGAIPVSAERVQFVTWNDCREGTDIESCASMLKGRVGK